MSIQRQTVGKMSKLTTHIGQGESQSKEFRFENPCVPKEEQQILYQNLLQKETHNETPHIKRQAMHMLTRSFVCWPPADDNSIVPTHATTGIICTVSFNTVPQ